MGKKFTIKQLAEISEVSVSTVSKALADSSEISESTKSKIRKLAKRFDYKPCRIAQSFKSGQSPIIGLILPYEFDSSVFEFVKNLENELSQNEMSFLFVFCNYNFISIEKKMTFLTDSAFINKFMILQLENYPDLPATYLTQKWNNLYVVKPQIPILNSNFRLNDFFLKKQTLAH